MALSCFPTQPLQAMQQLANHRRPHRFGNPLPQRVKVFRALQLGDMLCAIPALRALRAALRDAEIELIGLPWAKCLVERFPAYLDRFREFPGYPGLPEREPDVLAIPYFLGRLQSERYDLTLQLHGAGVVTNPLVTLFGSRHIAGFFKPGHFVPDPERYLPYPDRGLEIHRLLALVKFLGAPDCGDHLEFPVHETDRQEARNLVEQRDSRPGRYVCMHVGASVAQRRWSLERFGAVARGLTRAGYPILLTGSLNERELTGPLAVDPHLHAVDLAGKTSLGALAALLESACLLISNDTGVSHLAAALGTPSVILSTDDNPARWAPGDTERHRVLCPASAVEPREVLRHIEQLLNRFPPVAAAQWRPLSRRTKEAPCGQLAS